MSRCDEDDDLVEFEFESDLGDRDAIVSDDYDDDDDYDDYDDATIEDIDFVVALYREDGNPVALSLAPLTANDLDELIDQLRRLPGDAGALGLVSIAQEFFVLCRVRGRHVQVLLSDSGAATCWPIARDVADYLGLEVSDSDEDGEVWGDADLLTDAGVSELDLEAIASEFEDSDELVSRIVEKMRFSSEFDRAVAAFR